MKTSSRFALAVLILISVGAHVWGIRMDLPYDTHVDEPIFVRPAARIAASGNLNPRWFGNPGSTTIYPLAILYRAASAVTGLALDHPRTYEPRFATLYLIGRAFSIFYAVACTPLLFWIGVRAFDHRTALLGAWFAILSSLSVSHGRLVRTDSATAFFGLAGVLACLELYRRPALRTQIVAGVTAGLAIATKYYMGVLVGLMLVVDTLLVITKRRRGESVTALDRRWMLAGLVAVGIALAVSSPFLLLDYKTALRNIVRENRSTHLGHDGLMLADRLRWYLFDVVPNDMGVPRALLAAAGLAIAAWRRRAEALLVAGYVALFLLGINVSALHWERWLIPILPLLSLFAAFALWQIMDRVLRPGGRTVATVISVAVLCAISYAPARAIVRLDLHHSRPSIRLRMREWLQANLGAGTCVAKESLTSPIKGMGYDEIYSWTLSSNPLEHYAARGCRMFLTSSAIYGRYLKERERYPTQVAFYERLFREGTIRAHFPSDPTQADGTVTLYEWAPSNASLLQPAPAASDDSAKR